MYASMRAISTLSDSNDPALGKNKISEVLCWKKVQGVYFFDTLLDLHVLMDQHRTLLGRHRLLVPRSERTCWVPRLFEGRAALVDRSG